MFPISDLVFQFASFGFLDMKLALQNKQIGNIEVFDISQDRLENIFFRIPDVYHFPQFFDKTESTYVDNFRLLQIRTAPAILEIYNF